MADLKISALNALAGADLVAADVVAVVDDSASETKKLTVSDLIANGVTLISNSTIPSAKIVFSAGSIDTAELAASAVETGKINDSAVTAAKLADNSSVTLVSTLPGSGSCIGQLAVDTDDNKVYAYDGSSWVSVKGAGSINVVSGSTTGIVNIVASTSGDTVTVSATLDDTTAASQFLAGPSGDGGSVSYRVIAGADLPTATTSAKGGVIVNGNGLTMSSDTIAIDNTVTAETEENHIVQYDANGLVTGGRAIVAADVPVATSSANGIVKPGSGLGVTAAGELNHDNSVTAGTASKVTFDTEGHITGTESLVAADIPDLDAAKVTTGTFASARIASDAVTADKLADRSTATIAETTPAGGNYIGQLHLNSISSDLFLWDGNVWQPIGISVGEIILAGTYDASTNLMATVTSEGTALSFEVGSALPAASDANKGYYVVVSEAGTGESPAPTVSLNPPDFLLSTGSAYTEIDVSSTVTAQTASNVAFTAAGNIEATNVQAAIEELDSEKISAASPSLTGTVSIGTGGTIEFEGATANDFETTLTVADPTADRTVTLPDVTGTVVTTGDTGSVTSAMIADATIATGDIADSAVTTAKINDDAVTAAKLGAGAVDTTALGDASVTTAKLGADAVTNAKVADGAIDTEHLAASAVETAKINDGAVTTAKLAATSVTGAKIANLAVDTAQLAADAVTGAKIADDTINSEHYAAGSIDAEHLSADCVNGTKIADDAIDSEHLVDGSVDAAHLASSSVTTAKIAGDAVTSAKIADDAIDSEHLADGSIDAVHLSADCVNGSKIADDSIDSEHYVDGSIDAAHLATDSVTSDKIAAGAVGSSELASTAVTAATYGANGVPSFTVDADGRLTAASTDTTPTFSGILTCSGGASFTGNVTFNDNVDLQDNDKILLGTGDDLEIYHDGSDSRIDNNVGNVVIKNHADDKDVILSTDNGSGGSTTYVRCDGSTGHVDLTYYGTTKLNTKSDGIDVTGEVQCDSLDVDGDADISGDLGIGVSSPASKLHISGGTVNTARIDGSSGGGGWLVMRNGSVTGGFINTGGWLSDTTSGAAVYAETGNDIRFYTNGTTTERLRVTDAGQIRIPNNATSTSGKFQFGTSQQLSIFADSANGYITNNDFIIANSDASETLARFRNGGAVDLYHNNSKKIETTSSGVTVTGTVSDSNGNVRDIPQNSKTAAYTLVVGDAGKHINITTGGVTVPSGVFSTGDAVTIYNDSSSDQTVTQGSSVTLRSAGTADTGNRTLAQRGICTLLCVASNEFVISGAGLS